MPVNMDSLFGIHERSLLLRSKRANLLASNLANVDTPNYKAKDLDFSALLQDAKKQVSTRQTGNHTSHFTLANSGGQNSNSAIKYRNPLQPSLDGNTVENHMEQGRFSENAVRYQATLQFIGGRTKGLIRALRGE